MKFTIWKDVPVAIMVKEAFIRKIGKRRQRSHHLSYGDVPVAILNEDGTVTIVENRRGRAYAARKRLQYQNKQKFKGFRIE